MNRYLYILFLVIVPAYCVAAQKTFNPAIVVKADGNSCEINSAHVDYLRVEASNTRERVFVIARAGTNETDTLNLKRLQKVRQFLEKIKGFNLLDVVYSRGDSVKGEGQIDFYLGSNLRLTIKARFNRAPCMDCCDGDHLFSAASLVKASGKKKTSPRNK